MCVCSLVVVSSDLSVFFFASRRRHTRCALVTEVQTCVLPIFTFTVTRSGDTSAAGSVDYAVAGAADGADFAGGALPAGTLAFAAGETSKTLKVGRASCRERVCQYV